MKRLTFAAVLLAFALLVVQTAAADDAYMVGMQGVGSLMKSPVVYSGNFMFGLIGTWEITLDDSMWPDQADSTARFDYIWDNFSADNYINTTTFYNHDDAPDDHNHGATYYYHGTYYNVVYGTADHHHLDTALHRDS